MVGGELGPTPHPQAHKASAFPMSHHDGLDPLLAIVPSARLANLPLVPSPEAVEPSAPLWSWRGPCCRARRCFHPASLCRPLLSPRSRSVPNLSTEGPTLTTSSSLQNIPSARSSPSALLQTPQLALGQRQRARDNEGQSELTPSPWGSRSIPSG